MDGWVTLLGGLLGSVITIIVTKILDITQAKKNQEYEIRKDEILFRDELKKVFFARKLEVAEGFTKSLIQLISGSAQVKQLYVTLRDDPALAATDVFQTNQKIGQSMYDEAMKAINDKGAIIDLYFDIPMNTLDNSYLQYANAPMAFNYVGLQIKDSSDRLSKIADENSEEYQKENARLDQLKVEFKEQANNVIKMYDGLIVYFSPLIEEVRKKVRSFDSY